jgi:hypothetical protein
MKHGEQRSGGEQRVGSVIVCELLSHYDNDPAHPKTFLSRVHPHERRPPRHGRDARPGGHPPYCQES